MSLLGVENLSVRYGALTVLDGVSFTLGEGQWLMVVGPNGAGKSTLINAISQGAAYDGLVSFEGEDIAALKPAARARRLGVLAQSYNVGYSFTVGEVVRLGRYARSGGAFSGFSGEDEAAVRSALEITGMLPLKGRAVTALSGGELQRAFLAQLLAQNPRLLLLDEPTSHLDLAYQKQVFELLGGWLKTPGRAIISVVHDLSLARAYGSSALLLKAGRALACGDMAEVFTKENLNAAYSMDVGGWMKAMLAQWGAGR